MYEKPEVKVIEVSGEDIIQTSNLSAVDGNFDLITQGGGGIEFLSLRSSSGASGDVFQK